ncbi:MAG: methylated-DNA--[protein]-cysteine S-methyltransferase [Pseudomonadota bacterium]
MGQAVTSTGEQIDYITLPTVLGLMMMAATKKGICQLSFFKDEAEAAAFLAKEYPAARVQPAGADDQLTHWAKEVAIFLEKGGPRPDLPLDMRGTAFQLKVWQALRDIPAGQTTTYGALATKIGHPKAYRAVGSANGRNPVAVLVPCHLVVAAGGKLGGYAFGAEKKRHLLALETKDQLFA